MKQFEENNYAQVSKIQSKANTATEENKKLKKIIHGTNKDSDILEKKVEENKNLLERINTINKEKLNLEKKIKNLNIKLEQTKSKLDEESQINFALQKNQVEWQVKFSQLEKEFTNYKTVKDQEITELKEQVRHLIFF
ncbi:protein Daple-like [Daktulosphaira vitifoliae]|uniref:protein Daple-like n=1 Tax=Daktulosphaira vitifoliae TaxID=58002 RepID=UPI0021A9BA07|nr:protein Daple-like [Daktulosphaira vitifoliae]